MMIRMDENTHTQHELHFRSFGWHAMLLLNKLRLATQLNEPVTDTDKQRAGADDAEDGRNTERDDAVEN